MKGRQVTDALEGYEINVNMEFKKRIRTSAILQPLSYASRDINVECSTSIMNKCNGSELY